jgi:EAL domain-containing protein (putative c-di-GMP-specific phosphodiesterase class I)
LPDLTNKIAALREMGFRIAVDNLGTGYAGLTTFVRLEPEFVKLDMSLVRDLHRDEAKQKIVLSLIDLCHEMGKQLIAEGVEQAAECAVLKELGCDLLQGYFLGRPAPLTEPRVAAAF